MADKQSAHNFFEMMKAEHHELVGVMGEIKHLLATHQRDAARVDHLVTEFCDLIESHFEHEEEGGYLSEALEQAPRLTERAQVLFKQHESLLADARGLRHHVRGGEGTDAWWDELSTRFNDFTRALMTHEAHEDDLVQEAYTDDIGSKD